MAKIAAATGRAKKKKEYKITSSHLQKVLDDGQFGRLRCCGFVEFSGLDDVTSIEDAIAIRRLASGDVDDHDDEDGSGLVVEVDVFGEAFSNSLDHRGMVLVTTSQGQHRKYPFLLGAGFKKLGTWPGNMGHTVTLWAAPVLQAPTKREKSETAEIIIL